MSHTGVYRISKARIRMSIKKTLNENINTFAIILPLLIILFPLSYSVMNYVFAHGKQGTQPFIERPDERYKNCVRETVYMRFHHWKLLNEIREEVVRGGKRGEIGLDKCRECHPNRERFCNQCHNAVSLKPDCFGCHYYPASPQEASDESYRNGLVSLPSQPFTEFYSALGR